jgi:tetratricopeptide (TPR) repeat protein
MEDKVRYYQKIIRNPIKNSKELPGLEVIESLVDYCISTERFADALEFCTIWLDYLPDSADCFHKRAIILSQLNNPEAALLSINKSLSINSSDKDAILTKAIIFEQLGDINSGIELIDEVLKFYPGNEDALFRKAMLLQSIFKSDLALDILLYLENIEYNKDEVFQEIAHCYHMLYDYKNSALYYEKAINLNPFDYLIWYNFGVMYGHKGANYKSIDCYLMVLAIKSDFLPALFNLANTYAVTSRLVEAIDTYLKILSISPNDIDTLFNLASTFADNRQYLSAIEYYTKCINLEPTHHQAYFGRGYSYDAIDDFKNAIADFDIALQFTPNSKIVLQAKADLLYNIGKISESLVYYLQALELDPHDEHSLYDAAYIYFEIGDYKNAELYLNQLLDVTFSYADAWMLLAKIYILNSNLRKSVKCLLEAINLDSTKYDEFIKEFSLLTTQFNKIKSQIDKSLMPKKTFF